MQLPDVFSQSGGWNSAAFEAEMATRHRFPRLHTVFDEPGEYTVRVVAEGFAPRQVKAVLRAEEPRHVTSVVLPKGIATRGIVVKEDGRPCAGRRVRKNPLKPSQEPVSAPIAAAPACPWPTTPAARTDNAGEKTMLRWALIFFVISIVAAIFGFGGISEASADIAQILFYVFLGIFVIMLVLGLVAGKKIAG